VENSVGDEPALRWEPLSSDHDLETIVCYPRELQDYLCQQALSDQRSGKGRTYVACRGEQVVAYLTVTAGSVEVALSSVAIAKRRRRSLIPVVVIAQLGVDVYEAGRGLEEAMLIEAVLRGAIAADTFGARAVVTSAQDRERRLLLERFGFEPLPASSFHMFLAVEDILRSTGVRSVGGPGVGGQGAGV
jgi:hypothetical protein